MRHIKTDKLTELEKILISALLNSCPPGCSHEGCSKKKMNESIYRKGLREANKYSGICRKDPEAKRNQLQNY
jgi:hypothetical protein